MGPDKYYISGLEGGAVANGDILNLSIDLLDDYWVRDVPGEEARKTIRIAPQTAIASIILYGQDF